MADTSGLCLLHLHRLDPRRAAARIAEDYRREELDLRGLEIDADLFEAILSPAQTKDDALELPDAKFDWATFQESVRFVNVRFSGDAYFSGATFCGLLTFDGVEFQGPASFHDASFRRGLTLRDVRFGRSALFQDATFDSALSAADVNFRSTANFNDATFVDFTLERGEFRRDALFQRCEFGGETLLTHTRFSRVSFLHSTFQETRLGPMLVMGGLDLDDTTTAARPSVEASARSVTCRNAKFREGATLELRWANADFEGAAFGSHSVVTTPSPSFDERVHGDVFDEAQLRLACWDEDELNEFHRTERARISSLRRADAEHLILGRVDLRACRFFGAHALHGLVIESPDAFAAPPGRWLRSRRRTIAEEHEWRSRRTSRTTRHWFEQAVRPGRAAPSQPRLSPSQVATTYRQLRKGREEAKDEPGAADFYYGEMEMRRHRPGPGEGAEEETSYPALVHGARTRAERGIITAYWLISGYGLRASRALASLVVVLTLFTPAIYLYGFRDRVNPFAPIAEVKTSPKLDFPPSGSQLIDGLTSVDAWNYTVGTATSVIGGPESQPTTAGRVMRIVLRLLGPLLLGLALLAVRARVKR